MGDTRINEVAVLRNRTGVFADRREAGRVLAGLVAELELAHPLVLAIPAGGVPVAAALVEVLGCPLDVAVVSKVTLPWDTEAGYGAVAFDGSYQLNEVLVRSAALDPEVVAQGIAQTREKVARRVALFREGRPLKDLVGREVVLVDDGLASGFTLLVALAALRNVGATTVIVAVPTGHERALSRVAAKADAICCANIRQGLHFAVVAAYRRWHDVSGAEAGRLLRSQNSAWSGDTA